MRASVVAMTFTLAVLFGFGSTHAGKAYDSREAIVKIRDLAPGGERPKFSAAMGAAIDDEGYTYVADTSAHRIVTFNRGGSYIETFGGEGSAPGKFYYPHGLSIGDLPSGRRGLYVIDGGNHRVQVFTPEGEFIRQFGSYGSGPGQLNTPATIATMRGLPGSGVWVGDGRNGRIVQFSTSGKYLKSIDCAKCAHGPLITPVGLALRKVGDSYQIYVSEESAHRVRVITPEGREVASIGTKGNADGQLYLPDDIAFDEDGTLFVVDGNERVSVFGPDRKFVRKFNHTGPDPGEVLIQPHGLATGPNGRLLVIDPGPVGAHAYAIRPAAITLLRAGLRIRNGVPTGAGFLIDHNDIERTCDVAMVATFRMKFKTGTRTFVKSGAAQDVGYAGGRIVVDFDAAQSKIVDDATFRAVSVDFTGRCGPVRITSTDHYVFD